MSTTSNTKNGRQRQLLPYTLLVCFLLLLSSPVDAAFGRKKSSSNLAAATATGGLAPSNAAEASFEDDIPRVHFLVEMIGKKIYAVVGKPKYKFYIYMTVGSLPNEKATIVLISTICNVLYATSILLGFIFFQRGPMLLFALCTLWIGPALILILLGAIAVVLAAFALYPVASVAAMSLWFFLTSQLAQTLGKRLGLDSDGDGDVDWLDLLHFLSKTRWGQQLGLKRLHETLSQLNSDPFKEIHRRLDKIQRNTKKAVLNNTSIAVNGNNGNAPQQSYSMDDSEGIVKKDM